MLRRRTHTLNPKKKKTYKLPPLPKDDFKIIIRPRQGLPLRNIVSPALAAAIIAACHHQITGEQFLLRIKPGPNIAILSTPHQEVAAKARGIQHLTINGHKHAVNVYAAAGEEALRGVVHRIPPHTPAETLVANMRVRTHGVELIQARMIGDTKRATLTFSGPILPKVVYYYGGELVCHPFRATVQVCKLCRVRGHRTDVCPHPDRQICRMCGLENPSPEHPCELKCSSRGGPHATGDRSCTKRLKKPTAPRTPRPSRPQGARQARWFFLRGRGRSPRENHKSGATRHVL
ncbi:hypothetical protein MTO96_022789 [Rhipicephalus appendiculatus]